MGMISVTLLCIGRIKSAWAAEAQGEYVARLGPSLQILELPASRQKDPLRQRQEESERILEKLEDRRGTVWILDERGKAMTSPGFAKALETARDRGDRLTFVLGGAYGLTDDVRRAGTLLRLSDMTLPHELCRVVFLEQLYRAGEITRGSGYHH